MAKPPQQQQPQAAAIFRQQMEYSGPLPLPADLIKYNDAHPDAAHRIITMAENQATHRHVLENKVVDSNISNSRLGIICGFIIGMTTTIGGIVLLAMGKDPAGYAMVTVSVTGLVGVFVIGKYMQSKERNEKMKAMQLAAQSQAHTGG